jgi:hypothetical protein
MSIIWKDERTSSCLASLRCCSFSSLTFNLLHAEVLGFCMIPQESNDHKNIQAYNSCLVEKTFAIRHLLISQSKGHNYSDLFKEVTVALELFKYSYFTTIYLLIIYQWLRLLHGGYLQVQLISRHQHVILPVITRQKDTIHVVKHVTWGHLQCVCTSSLSLEAHFNAKQTKRFIKMPFCASLILVTGFTV